VSVAGAAGEAPQRVLVAVGDGVATVTLNRPAALNALDIETYRELERLAGELGAREDVRVVVLTGNGRAFCAGADLRQFAQTMDFDDERAIQERLDYVGAVISAWVHLDRPTIAAVNGLALGGGANLALACDLVLMREDATLGQTYVQRGLTLDSGASWFLTRLVGRARAAEIALLGEALPAQTAAQIGLVNRAVAAADWESTVADWAARLAAGAGRAQRDIKRGLLAAPQMSLSEILDWEAATMARIFQTDDLRESFDAFAQKRPPRYRGH